MALAAILSIGSLSAQYKSFTTPKVVRDIVADCGAKADGKSNDGQVLQGAIDELSAAGGGVVRIPKGSYQLSNVRLRSNISLEIEGGTVITLPLSQPNANTSLFILGEAGTLIKNVAIKGVGGRFLIDVRGAGGRPRIFSFKNVHNFTVSDVDIIDAKTTFPMMTFSPCEKNDEEIFGPTDGLIINASAYDCHYGYGLVQAHGARRVHFENLYGVGGVTLRFETGAKEINNRQFGGVFDVSGKNITGRDGNAVVMIAPHSMHNGVVRVEDVTSYGCGAGVRVEGGYISKKYSAEGLTGGSFDKRSYVKGVKAYFGMNAQLKPKHFKYMPEELLPRIMPTVDGISEHSPAIAAVLYTVNNDEVTISDVEAYGFTNESVVRDQAPRNK